MTSGIRAGAANRIERFTVSADMREQLHKLCLAVPEEEWAIYEEQSAETVYWSEVQFVTGDRTAMPSGPVRFPPIDPARLREIGVPRSPNWA